MTANRVSNATPPGEATGQVYSFQLDVSVAAPSRELALDLLCSSIRSCKPGERWGLVGMVILDGVA